MVQHAVHKIVHCVLYSVLDTNKIPDLRELFLRCRGGNTGAMRTKQDNMVGEHDNEIHHSCSRLKAVWYSPILESTKQHQFTHLGLRGIGGKTYPDTTESTISA